MFLLMRRSLWLAGLGWPLAVHSGSIARVRVSVGTDEGTSGEGAASDWCLRVEVGSCKGIVETNAGSCNRSPLHATKS